MVEEQPRRLFLALWPNAAERRQMAALVRPLRGGRKVKPDHLHLTLVFLGATDSERLRCYESALYNIHVPCMELTLDRLGFWFKPRLLWLGSSNNAPALTELAGDLTQRLSRCGYRPETRPFSAHITLIRKYPGPVPKAEITPPIHWSTQRIALVESLTRVDGAHYQVLRCWPED
jgi:2'-5' RNA ligase